MSAHKSNTVNKINDNQVKSDNTQNKKNSNNNKKEQGTNGVVQRNNLYDKAYESGKYSKTSQYNKKKNNYLIPIIFILAVLPLIVKMKTIFPMMSQYSWLLDDNKTNDFFLYYKQWFFVGIAAIMTIIIIHLVYVNKKAIDFPPIFIPLSIYALLSLTSTIFSNFMSISIKGFTDQYESIFVIIGYCIVAYYSYLYVKTDNDIKTSIKFLLVSVVILNALGLSQFVGHDFFTTDIGTKLITSFKNSSDLEFVFGKNRVYLTLFNPNYVGVYVSLVLPIFLVLLIFSKKLIHSLLYLIAIIGLAICILGAQSLSGIIGIAVSIIALLVFLWRYMIRRYYITIPIILVIVLSLFIINKQSNSFVWNKFQDLMKIEKIEMNLKEIETEEDKVIFNYKGNIFSMELITDEYTGIKITDSNNNDVYQTYDEATNSYIITDERFAGITFGYVDIDEFLGFYVRIDGSDWVFTNQIGDGDYYLYNRFGKLDKVVNAPSALFTGYENMASGRGYLWSRSLPLLKKYILVGSGPNTFVMVFPQQDYVGIRNYGYEPFTITKPHNLYLQTAIQTGVLSLIAFLAFYVMYFLSSFSLYIKGRFNNYYSQVGFAIFLGSLSYMVTGLTNDSSITTAPVFWVLIGVGIAANKKAKYYILEESSAARAVHDQD